MYTCPACMQDIEIDFGLESGDKFCCNSCYTKLCLSSEAGEELSVVETDLECENDMIDMYDEELENDLNDYEEFLEYSEYNAYEPNKKRKTRNYHEVENDFVYE